MKDFPDKHSRTACWDARDKYWECLDKYAPNFNRNNQSEKEPKECVELRKLFEKQCPSTWVKHFDRKRTYELFKIRMEKGFDPLEEQKNKGKM